MNFQEQTFVYAYFLLLIGALGVITSVLIRFKSVEFPARAVNIFKAYFIFGTLSWCLFAAGAFDILDLPLNVFVINDILVSFLLLFLWARVFRIENFALYLIPTVFLFVVLGFTLQTNYQLMMLLNIFNLVLYSIILFIYSNAVFSDRNQGDTIIMSAFAIFIFSSFVQLYLLTQEHNVQVAYQVAFISMSFAFLLIGIGFLTSLLLNEHEAQFALAHQDPLTGALNRRGLEHWLNTSRVAQGGSKIGFSLIAMDLDHFKKINDQYGHESGDMVLTSFSLLIKQKARERDVFTRIGGEEFLLILPNTSLEDALNIAERIRQQVNSTTFNVVEGMLDVTCSFGVSSQKGREIDVYLLMKNADKALYEAKHLGRDRVEVELGGLEYEKARKQAENS